MPEDDLRGLISEAYKIEGISPPECRSIFLDWALEPRETGEMRAAAIRLVEQYEPIWPEHPMTGILREAMIELTFPPLRRGGRKTRT
ncbi:MAG: hypothetical protein L3J37_05130 [Rhodobacteraceae bacterium]|nr:hypothetical protein [Paracoccaceae bacterium]